MALIAHPRCEFGEWRFEDGEWHLWKLRSRGYEFTRSQSKRPEVCDCGFPLVENRDGSLGPMRTR